MSLEAIQNNVFPSLPIIPLLLLPLLIALLLVIAEYFIVHIVERSDSVLVHVLHIDGPSLHSGYVPLVLKFLLEHAATILRVKLNIFTALLIRILAIVCLLEIYYLCLQDLFGFPLDGSFGRYRLLLFVYEIEREGHGPSQRWTVVVYAGQLADFALLF